MSDHDDRKRLDLALFECGLVASRSKARDFIKRSLVLVDGKIIDRPGRLVAPSASLTLSDETRQYVSRGGEKLEAALDHFKFDASGVTGLDIGASTGGFTEVLLDRGARKIFAVDVGHDQLHKRLSNDPRVVSLEGFDARDLDETLIGDPIDAIVVDVSFISLMRALEVPLKFGHPGCWLVALVKPQFEVGRTHVGKGGIVRDKAVREDAVMRLKTWIDGREGWRFRGVISSPIKGKSGNEEYLLGALYDG